MLLNVLSRAATAIGMIIAHPIRFLGHLVDAGLKGFNNFKDHILEHLKEGFMQWLFGAVAATGIQLPKTFDLPGILSLVLQVLGLTYDNIRARAVNILGEKVVKALETAAEIFKVLITKGPGGLWDYIKEQLGNLIDTVIDSIKSFIMEKVIIAGITWLIGLLNPASAFVKACKAIYDIIMFFVERGSQILDLVNAIIDSITAIADGKIDQAANWIEKSLARAIPVIIGFLASLLGVGGISEKIKEVIDKIRKPINSVIDWVINKAYGLAKAAGSLLGIGKKDDKAPKTDDPEHDLKLTAGLAAIDEEDKKREEDGRIDREGAEAVAATVRKSHPVFKTLTVIEGAETWDYDYTASPGHKKPGAPKKSSADKIETKVQYGPISSTLGGTWMKAHPLSPLHDEGSAPSDSPGVWDQVKPDVHSRQGVGLYVRGHLLNQQLGGPGSTKNLTPITYSANSNHLHSVEKGLKERVNKKHELVHYEVHVEPPSRAAAPAKVIAEERKLTRGLSWSWYPLKATGDPKHPKFEKQPGGESDFVENVGKEWPHV
jgi:hypothetical protein